MNKDIKILVTGANGYIGSKVVKGLCDSSYNVIATDINDNNIDNRAKFIKANIFEEHLNWYEFFEKPDVCLHLAWRDGFVHNSKVHIDDLPLHYNFLKNLVDNGLNHLSCMGSMHEIGYFEGKIDENTPCKPLSLYGISKNALRECISLLCSQKKCLFQWIRAYYIYGDDTMGNSIFCKLVLAEKEGKKTFPFTSGINQYDFIHIDELVFQLISIISQKRVTGIINACSGKPIPLSQKIESYIQENDLKIKLDYGKYPDRPYDSPCVYGDNSKISDILEKQKVILVTGVNGQLGYDCVKELLIRGYNNVIGIDKDQLDITNEHDVYEFVNKLKPDVIMHNAAWTAVDKAELMPEDVYKVNSLGTKYIASACKSVNAKMVYISTDYVFEGVGETPYEVYDEKKGLSIYGKTKASGEEFVESILTKYFIVRVSWVFGINGNNFVKTMLRLAESGKTDLSIVCDQIGSVTYTVDLAKLLCDMIITDKYGVYHATNEGYISWYDFAKKIFELSKININVNPITTENYIKLIPQQAKRPLNSRLSKKSLQQNGFNLLPSWINALERYLLELNSK